MPGEPDIEEVSLVWGVPGRMFTGLVGVDIVYERGVEGKTTERKTPSDTTSTKFRDASVFRRMTLPLTHADISSTIEKVQQQVIPAALVYTTHERWPLQPTRPLPKTSLHISVLDSSFNPPTLAHLALANAPNPFSSTLGYDAKLLLLSVRNADKIPQAGDATLPQRVEMMCLLAASIHHSSCGSPPNVAVGLVNEPTFIAKSSALRRFFDDRLAELTSSPSPPMHVQLTFLMGSS